MHSIFGLSWGELATILALISTIGGGFIWLLKKILTESQENAINKLNEAVDKLTQAVDRLNAQTDTIHVRISKSNTRLTSVETEQKAVRYHISDMDKQINILFKHLGVVREDEE